MLKPSTPNAVTGTSWSSRCRVVRNNNHRRSSQGASPRIKRRVRVWQHIGRQVARYELAVSVHDAEPCEPRSCAREPHCSELREAPTPFHAVLLAIEIEIEIEIGAVLAGAATKSACPDMDAAGKAEQPTATMVAVQSGS